MTGAHSEHAASLLAQWARMVVWIERLDTIGSLAPGSLLMEHVDAHRYERGFAWVGLTRSMAADCIKGMWRGALTETASELRIYLETHMGLAAEKFADALREARFADFGEPSEAEKAIFGGAGEAS